MRQIVLILVAAMRVLAQQAEPEIRGVVRDRFTEVPIVGARVEINEFLLVDSTVTPTRIGETSTDARGEFTFRPGHVGGFWVDVSKPGYVNTVGSKEETQGQRADLTSAEPTSMLAFSLLQPGFVSGRLVDQDGQPVAGLALRLVARLNDPAQAAVVTTDSDGRFRLSAPPGNFVLGTSLQVGGPEVLPYTPEGFLLSDEGFEWTYWPGEVNDPSLAVPFTLRGGADLSLGTLQIAKKRFRRVHVIVEGGCGAQDKWLLQTPSRRVLNQSILAFTCSAEFLVRYVGLGEAELGFLAMDSRMWALAELRGRDENVTATVRMQPAATLSGRVTAAAPATLESVGGVIVQAGSARESLLSMGAPGESAVDGHFRVTNLPWVTQVVGITPRRSSTFVKEVRYGGSVVRSAVIDMIPGAELEVQLDEGAGAVQGTLPGDGVILLVRSDVGANIHGIATYPPFQYYRGSTNRKFSIASLAPGDYRLLAFPANSIPDAATLGRLLANATKVTLEKGVVTTLEVKFDDPSR